MGIGENDYGCRYIHSQFDVNNKVFCHLDGAIRIYPKKKMLNRLNKTIISAGKKTSYNKIFRIDGEIQNDDWKSLVSNYFRGNSLVIEYFGEDNKPLESEKISERKNNLKQLHCSFLSKLTGLKIGISYHPLDKKSFDINRELLVFDTINYDDGNHQIIENDVFELKKALKKIGEDLEIPEEIKVIEYLDSYINYPIIRHGKNYLPTNINKTIEALTLILEELKTKNIVFSFTLAWPTESKEVRLSILGHTVDLYKWLNKFKSSLPLNDDCIPECARKYQHLVE